MAHIKDLDDCAAASDAAVLDTAASKQGSDPYSTQNRTKTKPLAANRGQTPIPRIGEFDNMRQTIFSPCRAYRYALWREWIGGEGYVMFVGLNPSTADETQDDPTIRRCIAFAKAWGYAGLCMTNLFAFRATDPKDMKAAVDPVGPQNDRHLLALAGGAGVIVAAWGANGTHRGRDADVRQLLPALHCLALTKDGHPGHPLYLRRTLTPVPMGSNAQG